MENLEYLDDYFNGEMLPGQRKQFEERILNDPEFAEDVAFYISVNKLAKEESVLEKKRRFSELYHESTPVRPLSPVRKIYQYVAAAAILTAIVVGWYLYSQNLSPQKMANRYVEDNFQTLGVTMNDLQDSLQAGVRLHNDGKRQEALQQFEAIIRSDSSNFMAKKYAGIVTLELEQYDKAMIYFRQLEQQTGLFSNPGKFYQAVTLMKRAGPGDIQQARELLEQVVALNLEGKETAQQWIPELK